MNSPLHASWWSSGRVLYDFWEWLAGNHCLWKFWGEVEEMGNGLTLGSILPLLLHPSLLSPFQQNRPLEQRQGPSVCLSHVCCFWTCPCWEAFPRWYQFKTFPVVFERPCLFHARWPKKKNYFWFLSINSNVSLNDVVKKLKFSGKYFDKCKIQGAAFLDFPSTATHIFLHWYTERVVGMVSKIPTCPHICDSTQLWIHFAFHSSHSLPL